MTSVSAARMQPWILPEAMKGDVFGLFFRGQLTLRDGEIRIPAHRSADSGTYFNALSVGKWLEHTIVDRVELRIAVAQGAGRLLLWHKRATQDLVQIGEPIAFDAAGTLNVPIDLSALGSGLIYWEIVADAEVRIADACYVTAVPRRSDVRIAVLVTNFHRDADVQRSIQRFQLSSVPAAGHRMIVVDNGGTLGAGAFSWGWIFDNPNAGGAGGFSRGMIEARQRGFTHVLMMDDDARTLPQSIERTANLLSWAKRDELAVVGGMLVSEQPWLQHEAGAQFRGWFGVQALCHAADLRDLEAVLGNDSAERIDYGAFWFFAAPLSEIRALAFPFFVRGDDVQFCQANRFELTTLNGACCWQPRFDDKITPVVEYLTSRSELVIAILRAPSGWSGIVRVAVAALKTALNEALEFRYGCANARCDGFDDALRGPDFWESHVSAVPQIAEVQRRYEDQKPRDVSQMLREIGDTWAPDRDAPSQRLRRLSLGGHLIPNALLKKEGMAFPALHATHGQGCLRRRILYYSPRTQTGFLATKSRWRFFRVVGRLARFLVRMMLRGVALRRAYEAKAPYLQSEAFWRGAMEIPTEHPAAPDPDRSRSMAGGTVFN